MSRLFKALGGRRCFIVYELLPRANGGTDKVPVNPQTRKLSNAQDSTTWLTADVALTWANFLGPSFGIGLVVYAGCGYGCIDIDGAKLADGTWSVLAQILCARFQGSYIEISISGNGIHIFFTYRGQAPAHTKRNTALHIEMYTELRFIAITGYGEIGELEHDATIAFHQTIAEYFPPAQSTLDASWTTEPHGDWSGPADDHELITRMLRSKSASAVFGGGTTFADLWNAEEHSLAKAFPAELNSLSSYNASSADQALSNHLAFWTGSNCDRMFNLMWQSRLARDKWERADYLPTTILKSVGWQKTFYKDPAQRELTAPVPLPPALTVAVPAVPTPTVEAALNPYARLPDPGEYVSVEWQKTLFDGCVYVEDVHRVYVPAPLAATLDQPRFDARFAGARGFQITADGQKPARSAWEAFVANEMYRFPKVRGLYFEPRERPGEIILRDGLRYVNSWAPLDIPMYEGDVTPFLDHLNRLTPNGKDPHILLQYLKFMVQHKGSKSAWCPFLQGVEGNGKTFISFTMQYCLGERYTHFPKASELNGRFNGAFYGKLFMPVNDVKISEDQGSMWECLKPMIDSPRLEIESKGVDKVTREVCFNFILNSNHKDGIRKTQNDRRLAPFFCAQQHSRDLIRDGMTEDYFMRLWRWAKEEGGWPRILYFLSTDPIDPEFNPADRCIRAPLTSSTSAAITASFGSVEQDIIEAIETGVPGFSGGWVSSIALHTLLASTGRARLISRNRRQDILTQLGYELHPGLPGGRIPIALADGTKPQLFVKAGHASLMSSDPAMIRSLFDAAQKKG